ncbi:PcfJ domain-containing protein (plasmid) [Komagataeibacter intermedius]|uniref:PcfJ domain-containing protein n=1 Tax=Komagataeibacter intermedius TaxID=66229 RepID=UPI004035677C
MTDEEKQRKIAEENRKLTDIQKQANLYAGKCPEFAKEWMKKRLESYAKKNDYNLPPEDEITNTRDWLHSLQEEDPKLANKIDRISWEAGQGHQQKWHDGLAKKAEKLSKFKGNPDDVTPMIKYEDGFQWVKLNSAEAKDFEGDAMGNCVGQGNYDDQTIFSLRDKDNFPHITVEYNEYTKTIEQMKCKGNSKVTDDYMPVVENLISELKPEHIRDIDNAISTDGNYYLGIDRINQATENGIKFDKDNIHTILTNYALSKDGSLFVDDDRINQASQEGVKFDKINISIDKKYAISTDGILYFGEDAVKNIPNDIVLKEVNIGFCKNITEFNNKVEGNFCAYCSSLEKIGPNAEFGGDVDIENCKNLTEFNHKVPGDFKAQFSGLEKIGPNADFGGDVLINGCENLTEFNHKVPGDFNAESSGLTKIGPNAEFGGNVIIKNCCVKEFNNKVEGFFNADDSILKTIGANAQFGGNFCVFESNLTTISPNADFGGRVDISGTPLCAKTGIYEVETPEEKQAFADAIKSMDSKQEQAPEQAPKPEEEEYSMSM